MALVKLPGFSGLRSGATPNPIIPSTNKTILAIPSMVVTAINEPIRANKIPATAATIMIIHAQAGNFFPKAFYFVYRNISEISPAISAIVKIIRVILMAMCRFSSLPNYSFLN
ncbi:MAG: hypothetical protein IPO03_01225 [Bacteroidetes bacterium]|nr:hypothetical protein [Bacteroidota bacterium]